MLDTKQSWDELVRSHAPDAATRDAILANPLYENITGRFVQSHDYIAMERLYEIHASGRYDLIVVDTPPTRNAIDFLEAPERMADFFSSRLLRWLTVPARSRVFTMASRPFYTVADRILGSQFLQDIAEFFLLFQTMYDGFVERAQAVTRTLSDKRTAFVVVSTLEAAAGPGGRVLHRGVAGPALPLGAVVLNKVLPAWFARPGGDRRGASACAADAERPGRRRSPVGADLAPPQVARVLGEVGESFLNFQVVATREAEQRARAGGAAPTWSPPSPTPTTTSPTWPACSSWARPCGTDRFGALPDNRADGQPRRARPVLHPPRHRRRSRTCSGWPRAGACWPTSASPTCCCSAWWASPGTAAATASSCWARCGRPRRRPCTGPTGSAPCSRRRTGRWWPGPTGWARSSRAR